jgi:heme O synthase-like polyprenyltransferase
MLLPKFQATALTLFSAMATPILLYSAIMPKISPPFLLLSFLVLQWTPQIFYTLITSTPLSLTL